VGGSFVVIHPGGVDITGPKINLNSGGSPGTPVQTQRPAVLKTLPDDNNKNAEQNDNEDRGTSDKSVCQECLKKAQEAAAAFVPRR
jgi:type VI secretion system secreted protein VgrG